MAVVLHSLELCFLTHNSALLRYNLLGIVALYLEHRGGKTNTDIEQLWITNFNTSLGAGVETGLSGPQIRLCSVHSQLCLRLKLVSKDEQTSLYFVSSFHQNFHTVVWLNKFLYVCFYNGNGF